MARLLADENMDVDVVESLRQFGHDVVTAFDEGLANRRIGDPAVLAHATVSSRSVLTFNRRHYHRLHKFNPTDAGIISCTEDKNTASLAQRIHDALAGSPIMAGVLIRIVKPSKP